MRLRRVAGILLATLVACPAAAGHGNGAARGYTSTVKATAPALDGLTVEVLDGDDRLQLRNGTGRDVVIEGYEGEPYLRFDAGGGVYRNLRSPATYLNAERYGDVEVPASASRKAAPRWEQVAGGRSYDWHDHRIHWMSTIDPPKVREAKGEAHHVFDWTVPGDVGGEPFAVRGSLDYRPPPKSRFNPLLIAPVVALALAGGIFWWARRPRARSV